MTRYRPVHIQTLFLAAATPADDGEHLYSAAGSFQGEGAEALRAVGLQQSGKSVEETLAAFQRAGYLLAYILECPVADAALRGELLQRRLPATLARIRRSHKPKRVVLVGQDLQSVVTQITEANLDAVVVSDGGRPFELAGLNPALLAALPAREPAATT